jgi:hypothetical protein
MNMKAKCWQVRDKGKLLLTLMKELEGDAHISIEGDLRVIRLSTEPTAVLKPITFGTDFVVLPLARSASEKIYAALGETVPKKVLHVQIEKNGVIQFGAYDYFHPECISFGNAIPEAVIASLVSNGIIRPQIER